MIDVSLYGYLGPVNGHICSLGSIDIGRHNPTAVLVQVVHLLAQQI